MFPVAAAIIGYAVVGPAEFACRVNMPMVGGNPHDYGDATFKRGLATYPE